jgi:hypothetical protein
MYIVPRTRPPVQAPNVSERIIADPSISGLKNQPSQVHRKKERKNAKIQEYRGEGGSIGRGSLKKMQNKIKAAQPIQERPNL